MREKEENCAAHERSERKARATVSRAAETVEKQGQASAENKVQTASAGWGQA